LELVALSILEMGKYPIFVPKSASGRKFQFVDIIVENTTLSIGGMPGSINWKTISPYNKLFRVDLRTIHSSVMKISQDRHNTKNHPDFLW